MVPRPRDRPALEPRCCLTWRFSVLRPLSRRGQVRCWFRDPQPLTPSTRPAVNKRPLWTIRPIRDPAAHVPDLDGRKGWLKAAAGAFATKRHVVDLDRRPNRL